ncbi:MAG: hypothetical protein CMJ75_03850 [Planctomycetaceae bacterium]|nr:hypothetical protein [Planctomycetaceae bacterium]
MVFSTRLYTNPLLQDTHRSEHENASGERRLADSPIECDGNGGNLETTTHHPFGYDASGETTAFPNSHSAGTGWDVLSYH